jgi:hypothetical protein
MDTAPLKSCSFLCLDARNILSDLAFSGELLWSLVRWLFVLRFSIETPPRVLSLVTTAPCVMLGAAVRLVCNDPFWDLLSAPTDLDSLVAKVPMSFS